MGGGVTALGSPLQVQPASSRLQSESEARPARLPPVRALDLGAVQAPETAGRMWPHAPPVPGHPQRRGARGRGNGRPRGRLAGGAARLCGEGPVLTARPAVACQVSGRFLLTVTLKGIRPDSNVRRKQSLLSHHLSHAP